MDDVLTSNNNMTRRFYYGKENSVLPTLGVFPSG